MAGDLAPHVERFVLQHLRSLEHLDAVLAMHREPERWWTDQSISDATGAPLHVAEQILEDLCSANLLNVRITSAVAYQFNPGSEDLKETVADVVDALRLGRTRVYTLITSRSSRALRDFADAFRLRRPNRG